MGWYPCCCTPDEVETVPCDFCADGYGPAQWSIDCMFVDAGSDPDFAYCPGECENMNVLDLLLPPSDDEGTSVCYWRTDYDVPMEDCDTRHINCWVKLSQVFFPSHKYVLEANFGMGIGGSGSSTSRGNVYCYLTSDEPFNCLDPEGWYIAKDEGDSFVWGPDGSVFTTVVVHMENGDGFTACDFNGAVFNFRPA